MKKIYITMFILFMLAINSYTLAGENCCLKQACKCTKNACCVDGQCTCKGNCCNTGSCKCAEGKCSSKCSC